MYLKEFCATIPDAYGDRSSAWLEHLVVVQRVAGSSPVDRPRNTLSLNISYYSADEKPVLSEHQRAEVSPVDRPSHLRS